MPYLSALNVSLRGRYMRRQAVATLEARPARKGYARELKINVGVDNKRQVGLFDPDGTRVEMMEIDTIDGKPAPSSTLPPPR
jgi:hypothetical protein